MFGNAQNTDTELHHKTAIEILTDAHKEENLRNIIDRDLGLNGTFGDKVRLQKNIRTDISVSKPDSSIKIIEVVSDSQTKEALKIKCAESESDITSTLKKAGMKVPKVTFKVLKPEEVLRNIPS